VSEVANGHYTKSDDVNNNYYIYIYSIVNLSRDTTVSLDNDDDIP